MQFSDFFQPTTVQDFFAGVKTWFMYNPDEPMLFSTVKFLRLFLMFYLVYILVKDTFKVRIVVTAAFSLYFY